MVWAAARDYAKSGIYVFPVYVTRKADGKKDVRPAGLWRNISSASLADIAVWEQEHPDAGLGIDTGKSGLVVVDPDGQEGIEAWLALNPPMTARVRTPGGGEHWYYRAHPDHAIGNDQNGKVAPAVDVRGLGGFVIAPPTSDGTGSWEWIDGSPDRADLPVVPDLVIERMTARTEPAPSPEKSTTDDLFDDAQRAFTEEQAKDFIRKEREKLAATVSGFNGAINNFAMACAHFPWLVSRGQCGKHMIKALGPKTGWTEPDRDDIATIESAYSATEAGKSWIAVKREGAASLRGGDSDEAHAAPVLILPPPSQPVQVARALLGQLEQTAGETHWTWWRDEFYRWVGAHWEVLDQAEVNGWLYRQTADARYIVPAKKEGEDPAQAPWAPTRKKIGDLADALGVGVLQRTGEAEPVLAARNGVIVNRELLPHRPSRFNLFSLPFDYQPEAQAPAWHTFLDQVLPDDRQAQEFLAEWFGYVLSGRTDQQKMAALIGKKRSGKGTIARVLTAVIGKENVAGLNLGTLGNVFGLEPFVGTALAVASDVRWHSRTIGDAIQPILEVTGEDHVTVHRKNQKAWKGRLGVRFMLMSNDTPTFSDRSGALVDRMIYVSFKQSFYGREDTTLTEKLMDELPGILNWALDGLDRLDGRGRFTQPVSGEGEREATRRLADPIGAFVEDWCVVGEGQLISLDHLYLKYRTWCEGEGRTKDSTTKEIFSRDLRQKFDGIRFERKQVNGKRMQMITGIGSDAV
jgi:putative DNA primase/helicase